MAKRSPVEQTAFGPMLIVATEQQYPAQQRVLDDELAVRMLPGALRSTVGACRWAWLRETIIKASEKRAPGVWGGMLGRKRYADDQVMAALDAGVRQVVFLGAGLDTRACRLVAPAGVEAFELDLPDNSAYKRRQLEQIYGGRLPEHLSLVPIDFGTDDLAQVLAGQGFRLDQPTMFVWEAVTQYLTEAGVRRTFEFLAKAPARSRLSFTYCLRDFLSGERFYGAEALYREFVVKQGVWHYGLLPDEVPELLAEYGWKQREQVGAEDYITRYLEPLGRTLPVMAIERFVSARKTG